jgi:hypothetical protein
MPTRLLLGIGRLNSGAGKFPVERERGAGPPLENFWRWPVVQNLSVLPLACAEKDEYH